MKHKKYALFIFLIVTFAYKSSSLYGNNHDPFLKHFSHIFRQFSSFYNDPFDDPFFDDFFSNHRKNTSSNPDEESWYIVVHNDPQQIQQPGQKQLPQQQKSNSPKIQKRYSYQQPQQNISQGSFLPIFGNIGGNTDPRMNQFLGQGQGQTSYKQYDPNSKNKILFSDVLGQKEAIKEVVQVVDFLKNPAEYQKLGAEIPKGILLEGPPGNGKTLLARAIAGEAGCTFIHASGSQFVNKYVGTGADNIRKLFDQARTQAPAIIFIDEIDAIGSREGDENQEYRHTVNELLTQMDGFTQEDNVIVIAATNFSKSLDKALLRPGRFDRIVKLGLPTKIGREEILLHYIKKKNLDPALNTKTLAKEFSTRTPGFSGAELKKLANEAALTAREEKVTTVNIKHFEKAYDKIILGLINELDRSPEQLKRTAYHEAGHVLVKIFTDQPIAKVSILSRGDALGVTFEKEKYENASEYQKEELLNKIMALQGGFVAEKLALNSTRPGASADLEQVNQYANAMVKEFGMGEGELEGITYKGMISDSMKEKFDKEVLKLIQKCKQKTEELLTNKMPLLSKLADRLLEKETLNETDIYKAVGKKMHKDEQT